jgi:uncharacterized protein
MKKNTKKLKEIANKLLTKCPAHDITHVDRVYEMSLKLAKGNDVDLEVIEAAALLHDIGGKKELDNPSLDHSVEGAKMAKKILQDLDYPEEKIKHIQDCIVTHRYRTNRKPKTLEAKIIFDADKLETVGAIGIARIFVWIGTNNAKIYEKVDLDEYAKENLGGKRMGRIKDHSKYNAYVNWETKTKHVLKFLYTDKAKEIAKDRLKFTKKFFDRLDKEIDNLV